MKFDLRKITKLISMKFSRWIAATQMEALSARKVFPCFDEPQFKASFSIIVNRPPHFKPTLSNTAMASSYYTSSK